MCYKYVYSLNDKFDYMLYIFYKIEYLFCRNNKLNIKKSKLLRIKC